jgi:site-specific DNA-methyltransferase (adenine-specific)
MTIDLILGDCMLAMKDMPDKAFDLAIVDPPYGIGCDGNGMSNRASNSPKFRGYTGKQFKGGGWDKEPETRAYFVELKRVSVNQIIWGANHFIENIPEANSSCWIVWRKNGQNPNATNADCELAYTNYKTAVRFFNYDWSGFGAINQGEIKIHPTQKPVALYKWLLKNYAKPGDKILDTHLGSGSIAIACYDMGFDLTGYEIDKEYYEATVARIEQHKKQLVMDII